MRRIEEERGRLRVILEGRRRGIQEEKRGSEGKSEGDIGREKE